MNPRRTLKELVEIVERQNEQVEQVLAERKQTIGTLVAQLRKGKTTGDMVTDFMIVQYGNVTGEHEEIYRRLQRELKPGQQVLVVEESKTHMQRPSEDIGFFPPAGYTQTTQDMRLGVLKGGMEVNLRNPAVILPMETYLMLHRQTYDTLMRDGSHWTRAKGPILLEPRLVEIYDDTLLHPECFTDIMNGRSVRIYTGRDVPGYFRMNRGCTATYAEALKLLRLHVPKIFQEAYDRSRRRGR